MRDPLSYLNLQHLQRNTTNIKNCPVEVSDEKVTSYNEKSLIIVLRFALEA